MTGPTMRNVSLLCACVTIKFCLAPGHCGGCGLYRSAYFLGRPGKVLRTSLDHEFADLRPGRKVLLLQAEFRVVGEEKARGDRRIPLPYIDAATSLIPEGRGKGDVRQTQSHRLPRRDRAG